MVQERKSKCLFFVVSISVCNRAFTATAAPQTFTSPGYPDGYVDDLDCRYIITAPPTGTIMVNLTDVNLEDSINCGYDYVRVYDGEWPPTDIHRWVLKMKSL